MQTVTAPVLLVAVLGAAAASLRAAEPPLPPAGLTVSGGGATATCVRKVVLMGYWPPTNEMLRPWSTHPAQNPGGWIGANWGGYGYDVVAYFPEFPPDGDPSNDPIGSPGSVGSADSDLQVDYQDTSADFWRIVTAEQPSILITTSRGGATGWEVEAVEGGHDGGTDDPAMDWMSDRHGEKTHPTEDSVDARTWDAISEYRRGKTLPSQLPMDDIVAATRALNLVDVEIDTDGTSGNYLSGFLGLHGLYYNHLSPHNVAAGHIHVGIEVPAATARALMEATLHAVLSAHEAASLPCP